MAVCPALTSIVFPFNQQFVMMRSHVIAILFFVDLSATLATHSNSVIGKAIKPLLCFLDHNQSHMIILFLADFFVSPDRHSIVNLTTLIANNNFWNNSLDNSKIQIHRLTDSLSVAEACK